MKIARGRLRSSGGVPAPEAGIPDDLRGAPTGPETRRTGARTPRWREPHDYLLLPDGRGRPSAVLGDRAGVGRHRRGDRVGQFVVVLDARKRVDAEVDLFGSAYIREMYDRYGSPGFIAAYNAGPARYDEYLTYGRELPDETLRYVVAVGAALGENFEGSVFGELPLGAHPTLRFHEPITVSSNGVMLESRTGQPVPVTDRLALHSLLARAVGVSAAR